MAVLLGMRRCGGILQRLGDRKIVLHLQNPNAGRGAFPKRYGCTRTSRIVRAEVTPVGVPAAMAANTGRTMGKYRGRSSMR